MRVPYFRINRTGQVVEQPTFFGITAWQCKSSSQQQSAATAQENLFNQQASFYNQLTSMFSQQFSQYQSTFNNLMGQAQQMVNNPTGTGNAGVTAMRTAATENNSSQFQSALQAFQNQGIATGANQYSSGSYTTGLANLYSAGAAQNASSQNQITQNVYNTGLNMENSLLGQEGNMTSGLLGSANNAGSGAASSGGTAYQSIASAYAPTNWLGVIGSLVGGAGVAMTGLGNLNTSVATNGWM